MKFSLTGSLFCILNTALFITIISIVFLLIKKGVRKNKVK